MNVKDFGRLIIDLRSLKVNGQYKKELDRALLKYIYPKDNWTYVEIYKTFPSGYAVLTYTSISDLKNKTNNYVLRFGGLKDAIMYIRNHRNTLKVVSMKKLPVGIEGIHNW